MGCLGTAAHSPRSLHDLLGSDSPNERNAGPAEA
jgi:hypothetical protein